MLIYSPHHSSVALPLLTLLTFLASSKIGAAGPLVRQIDVYALMQPHHLHAQVAGWVSSIGEVIHTCTYEAKTLRIAAQVNAG